MEQAYGICDTWYRGQWLKQLKTSQKNPRINYGKSWKLSRKLYFSNVLQVLFLPGINFTRQLSANGEALHDAAPATDC